LNHSKVSMGAQFSQDRVDESRIYNTRQWERGQDGVWTRVGPLCLCSAGLPTTGLAVSSQLTDCWTVPMQCTDLHRAYFALQNGLVGVAEHALLPPDYPLTFGGHPWRVCSSQGGL